MQKEDTHEIRLQLAFKFGNTDAIRKSEDLSVRVKDARNEQKKRNEIAAQIATPQLSGSNVPIGL